MLTSNNNIPRVAQMNTSREQPASVWIYWQCYPCFLISA